MKKDSYNKERKTEKRRYIKNVKKKEEKEIRNEMRIERSSKK